MLRLSAKIQYGTRLMFELGLHYGKGFTLLRQIAESQEISVGYLEQIIPHLRSAGLVTSSRGPHGGYSLVSPPFRITLGQIIKSLEGDVAIVKCVEVPGVCRRVNDCVVHDVWEGLNFKIQLTLDSINLQHMIDRYHEKKEVSNLFSTLSAVKTKEGNNAKRVC